MPIGPRSNPLRRLARYFRIARDADAAGVSSAEALEIARDRERAALSRRPFIGGMAAASAFAVTGTARKAFGAPKPPAIDVGIVGAGLAGLQCAYELGQAGLSPS